MAAEDPWTRECRERPPFAKQSQCSVKTCRPQRGLSHPFHCTPTGLHEKPVCRSIHGEFPKKTTREAQLSRVYSSPMWTDAPSVAAWLQGHARQHGLGAHANGVQRDAFSSRGSARQHSAAVAAGGPCTYNYNHARPKTAGCAPARPALAPQPSGAALNGSARKRGARSSVGLQHQQAYALWVG